MLFILTFLGSCWNFDTIHISIKLNGTTTRLLTFFLPSHPEFTVHLALFTNLGFHGQGRQNSAYQNWQPGVMYHAPLLWVNVKNLGHGKFLFNLQNVSSSYSFSPALEALNIN